jgi:hypothetical protein
MTTDITRQELEQEEALNHSIDTMLYLLRTATPAVVVSFNEAQNSVHVQPSLMGRQRNKDAKPLPELLDVPVLYYGAGDYVITHKPKAGDQCLLIASDRSLSRWKQAGGVVDPAERRRHNLTDSVAYFGLNHYAAAYPDIKDGIDIRTRDGQTSLNLTETQLALEIGGAPIFTASSSGVAFSVPITAPEATIAGVTQSAHKHTGVQTGPSSTGGPTN